MRKDPDLHAMNLKEHMPRVLVIGPGMEIGGVERSLSGLLRFLVEAGCETDLFLFSHTGSLLPTIDSAVRVLPEDPWLARIHRPVRKLIRQGNYYTVFVRTLCKAYGTLRRKRGHKADVSLKLCQRIILRHVPENKEKYDVALGFFEPHDYLTDKVDAKVKIGWVHTDYCAENRDPAFDLFVWGKLDYIACVSEKVREAFIRKYPSEADKTIVIPNVVSPEMIREQSMEETCIPESEDDGAFRIMTVARFSYAKGMDRIPAVCRKLTDQGYRIRWYLIGYGPDEAKIREEIRRYSVAEQVKILGPKDNPYPYMRLCDLYVQPSRYEGKAVAVTEAQILHKPVMITRYPTSSDQLDEGGDGFICEEGTDGIANGIQYLMDHPGIRDAIIQNTRGKDYSNAETVRMLFELVTDRTEGRK